MKNETKDFGTLADSLSGLTTRGLKLMENYLNAISEFPARIKNAQLNGGLPIPDKVLNFTQDIYSLNKAYWLGVISISKNLLSPSDALNPTTTTSRKSNPQDIPQAQSSVVPLVGSPGDIVSGAFLVENRKSHPIFISFTVNEFIPSDESAPYLEPTTITFTPNSLSLNPGEEVAVKFVITLTDDFLENLTYSSRIGVKGIPGIEIPLLIFIQPLKHNQKIQKRKTTATSTRSGKPPKK